ncbi:MAG TPA: DUF6485 family protein [Candidatus Omnitrophota bacterium]|nr:DUF6485 family protein [Candidatus Omnitrophota bacterium]
MECKSASNKKKCNCSYEPCSRKGVCCDCLHYHRSMGQLPACFFPDDIERTYDRSISKFMEIHQKRR